MPKTAPTPEADRLLVDAETAARMLGISRRLLWSLTQPRGEIPAVKIGTRVLYSPDDLRQWIAARKQTAPAAD